jgi:asparagine synthase (glutamine-hydrolysing)
MCGIAGIFHYADPDRPIDRELLMRMTRALEHRGPDDEGFYIEGPIGLGHRRLSIVDLSPTGHQPMPNEDHSCWITYNGEFYNHAEFRARLVAQGHTFRGTSDTETLLHLVEESGPDALRDASAIFGFAFWDGRRRQLTLARDPLGVKQVYYHDNGRRIVFASEIKALLECPDVPREADPEAVNQYLHFHTTLFERTFFKQIQQLRAGEYLQIARTHFRRRTYWKVEDFRPNGNSVEENVAALREQLSTVVNDQLMADVPVGSFFSGGIDSSAVAAMAIRAGKPPVCFGVHFENQGVVDERPYQEAAAKALGLDLNLITLDGATFPEDLMRLIYHQDEPVIGAAMLPMYAVSRLASRQVKVCLGGQAADEVFGGYARYGLSHPWRVMKSWFAGSGESGGGNGSGGGGSKIGGNLWSQVADRKNLKRLADNVSNMADWQARYFAHFAIVPEAEWNALFDVSELVSRRSCYDIFRETVAASPATDPADKVMHWDLQTYLTGLFHQDDRMSMACSLESRVPLADPRLVQFAFHLGFDLKFRAGATKWLLRQAVADVLPAMVLNRRKIGFDTPAETWMKGDHAGFVRDLLLSGQARERGFWNTSEVARLLDTPGQPRWFDRVWKLVCIEAWARNFLTSPPPQAKGSEDAITVAAEEPLAERTTVRDAVQEFRELGVDGTIFRVSWEMKQRSGISALLERPAPKWDGAAGNGHVAAATAKFDRLPFGDPEAVATAMRARLSAVDIFRLQEVATDAAHGRILAFGRTVADYGRPIDWHVNPTNGRRWTPTSHWSKSLREEATVGDVKLTWEAARFPQAYQLVRAAAFVPELRAAFAGTLTGQIEAFVEQNPFGRGVHWNSGQEIVFRLMAWVFGLHVLQRMGQETGTLPLTVARAVFEGALHVERHLDYAHKAVYNNHLLSEAFGLYLAARLWPDTPEAARWQKRGLCILEEEAERQCYPDGGYIQQSHNYHRVAMQIYLWAWSFYRAVGQEPPGVWRRAMERSLDFLVAHQNPADGRLPNYGANDGALPSVLSTCNFSDFRPVLQALSVATRGERIYEPGPWDETTAWLLGAEALEVPLHTPERKSVSFAHTGFHVLRGHDPETFAAFRCGTVLDRFSQVDMLHLDVWWRGLNVLVDGGSYLYNGPEMWHSHFLRTASHNTVEVDGRDQMLHYRRFKNLYWTRAKLLKFEDAGDYAVCSGEHYGYQRHPGRCVHRRSVLFVKDELWVVVDHISGGGTHAARLHWLCGDFAYDETDGGLTLGTPKGDFSLTVFDERGRTMAGDVVAGREKSPRGWLSRYYGEKQPVPSLAVKRNGPLPLTFVSVIGASATRVEMRDGLWVITGSRQATSFRIADGLIVPEVAPVAR